jgi:hypothetical protein
MGSSPLERNAVKLNIILFSVILFIFISFVCTAKGSTSKDANEQSVIIVVGAGGTAEYASEFAVWAQEIQQDCLKGNVNPAIIGIDQAKDINDIDKLQNQLSRESTNAESALWLVLIGHGTYDGKTAKFNLRGPDISADVLADWLKPFKKPVIVIDAFSSSAPFLTKLAASGRIIVSATKSGFEYNYSRFGHYFAAALADPNADLDKDGQTSLLETFLIASKQLAEFYSSNGRLATEHPLLDDNGDGLGTSADWYKGVQPVQQAANNAPVDGYRAHQVHLVRSDFENKIPPDIRAKRDKLELEIVQLRQRKDKIKEDEYLSRLESLLYEIALIYKQTENPDK